MEGVRVAAGLGLRLPPQGGLNTEEVCLSGLFIMKERILLFVGDAYGTLFRSFYKISIAVGKSSCYLIGRPLKGVCAKWEYCKRARDDREGAIERMRLVGSISREISRGFVLDRQPLQNAVPARNSHTQILLCSRASAPSRTSQHLSAKMGLFSSSPRPPVTVTSDAGSGVGCPSLRNMPNV